MADGRRNARWCGRFGNRIVIGTYGKRSLANLMTLQDQEFVTACYQWILQREPDPSGMGHYLVRVAVGDDRLAIAAGMASSDEAQNLRASQKALVGEILETHAGALLGKAETDEERAEASLIEQSYISCLTPKCMSTRLPQTDGPAREASDPFQSYLDNVINAGNE